MVTVVLHEMAHGLGFYPIIQSNGSFGTGGPSAYARRLALGTSGAFLSDMAMQAERATAIISNNMYADGPYLRAANDGARVNVYAPGTFASSSSLAHWGNYVPFATFMKGWINADFALHTPDTRMIGLMKDMGWSHRRAVFEANGGMGTMASQFYPIGGEAQALRANAFTRANYTFTGWNTAANGTGTAYADRQVVELAQRTALYAQWRSIYGAVSVSFISPQGAAWSLDSGVAWNEAGATVGTLTPAEYVVTFKDVAGYTTPPAQTITVVAGETTAVNVAYLQSRIGDNHVAHYSGAGTPPTVAEIPVLIGGATVATLAMQTSAEQLQSIFRHPETLASIGFAVDGVIEPGATLTIRWTGAEPPYGIDTAFLVANSAITERKSYTSEVGVVLTSTPTEGTVIYLGSYQNSELPVTLSGLEIE